jgi:ankyrin repeat protein
MKFEEDVLHELGQLPKELKDIWCAIYEEVDSAGDTARRIANTALQWLLCAQGRLSAADFVTAVSFDSTGKVVQMDTPKFLDICGNLVAHDTELDVFRFTHLSVREFLETRNDFAPKISHSTAAEICLNTLLTRDWLSSEITWQKATLYQYATLYWASHIENCRKEYGKSKIGDALTQMFTRDERVAPWFGKWLLQVESASQTLGWDDPLKDKIEQSLSHPETCLFTACTFGFSDVVRQLSKASPPAIHRVNAKGATGLHLASQFGHLDIVRTLLDGGVEIDAQDEGMETALTRACSAGHEDIVALLLERGADRTVQGKKYGTALQVASLHGHKEVAERLLEGVDIDAESGQFGTALQAASLRGHDKVVRVLLQNGANVNALGGEYAETTDLSPGKRKNLNGVSRVIEFLLKRQAELKKEHVREKSPQTQHESIVQLLLDGGIDINIQSSGFGPAIHAASRGGHENVVRTLLASGAEFRMEGGAYGSALQAASVSGSDAVVQLLLEAGADVNFQTGVYNTPLQAACRYQHENIIRMLLARDADVNAQGGVYGSALQAAARTGSKRIVGLLFENQADVNAQGGTYCTALQAASAEGFYEIVRVLLERGVRISQYSSLI